MKNNITEAVFILDRSGSMAGLEKDTVGGFNAMIQKQKNEPGKAFVTTVLFDNECETLHDRIDVANVPKMTEKEYYVRGCTALIDAIGSTVEHISNIHRYARPEDVPEHTVFIITTDGMENASRKYSSDAVKKMIEQKKESGWEFIFLGANIDAVETASHFGISADRAANYCCDSAGTGLNFTVMANAVSQIRQKGSLGEGSGWKAAIDEDFKNRKNKK